jgi:hypothetical protein
MSSTYTQLNYNSGKSAWTNNTSSEVSYMPIAKQNNPYLSMTLNIPKQVYPKVIPAETSYGPSNHYGWDYFPTKSTTYKPYKLKNGGYVMF